MHTSPVVIKFLILIFEHLNVNNIAQNSIVTTPCRVCQLMKDEDSGNKKILQNPHQSYGLTPTGSGICKTGRRSKIIKPGKSRPTTFRHTMKHMAELPR
jgi:hypothetical protein